jgi:hypothetical protein
MEEENLIRMNRGEQRPLLPHREIHDESESSGWESLHHESQCSSAIIHTLRGSWNKPHVRARIGPAAHLIRDAAMDLDAENPSEGAYDPYHARHKNDTWRNVLSLLCHRVCAYPPVVKLFNLVAWAMLFLTFIEPPYWCLANEQSTERSCASLLSARGVPAGAEENEIASEVEYYPNAHAMLVDEATSRQIECVLVAILFGVVLLRIGRDGLSLTRYLRKGPARWNRLAQLASLSFIAYGLWTDHASYCPYARLAIVMSLDNFGFQRELRDLVEVLPRVFQILALLSLLILFYGWFGTLLFANTMEGKTSFSNLVEAIVRTLPAAFSKPMAIHHSSFPFISSGRCGCVLQQV